MKRLTDVQLARYNTAAADLAREVEAFEDAARRAALASFAGALADARAGADAASRQKDEGSADAVTALERARDGLRQAGRTAFTTLIDQLLSRVRDEGGDPAELESIDGDYRLLGSKRPHEQAAGWARVVTRLNGLRVVRLQRATESALFLAGLRADPAALAPLRARFDEARGLEPVSASAALLEIRAATVALEGPTPKGLREVARDFAGVVTEEKDEPFFFTMCAAPDGAVAVLGPLDKQKTLFLVAVNAAGKLRTVRQAAVPLQNAAFVAPAGPDLFWIAEINGQLAHRFRFSGNRLVEEGDPVNVRSEIFDLEVAPDGTLYVATLREVRAYVDGAPVPEVGARVEREFEAMLLMPRRLTVLTGGGFVVTGHVPASRRPGEWWNTEKDGGWTLTLRAWLPGDAALREYQPRGRNLSGVAACGGGFLAAQHAAQGDIYFVSRQLEPSPSAVALTGLKPELAQDLVVSGRRVYVLDKQADKQSYRRRLIAYEME